ncbi:interleukin-8-like isoform X1 [Erpetoichthys calabaricus]|uniref:Interleukin-8-like n=1 Tax=Erpetoichthys calabaricus TaxID=27687 RepID=A0A8C4SDM3_ERPCA|nr:interleukin-8-like isoform X1 [Erpetoichthys calabaricus]
MNCRIPVTVAVFLLALTVLSEGFELRCQCIKKESRFFHPKRLLNVELFPSGPHCKDAEVIASLKTGEKICLEPTAPWVKLIIKKILESSQSKSRVKRVSQ